jgi:uncharacterized protein YndB with AHSA1/START domain
LPDTATMHITADRDAIISEIDIAAPPDRVFQALIDPQQVLQWWGQTGIYRCTEFAADVRPGGQWRSAGIGPDGGPFEARGEYIEVEPPRLLIYSWVASWTGALKTTIRCELTRSGKGTQLRLSHGGLASHPELAQSYRGWPRMLGWLKAFLERGETVETRAPFSVPGS